MSGPRKFVSLGMFIIDEFAFLDHAGNPTGRTLEPQEGVIFHTYSLLLILVLQIGGGGTYANVGARVW
jgi:hypothetical protein